MASARSQSERDHRLRLPDSRRPLCGGGCAARTSCPGSGPVTRPLRTALQLLLVSLATRLAPRGTAEVRWVQTGLSQWVFQEGGHLGEERQVRCWGVSSGFGTVGCSCPYSQLRRGSGGTTWLGRPRSRVWLVEGPGRATMGRVSFTSSPRGERYAGISKGRQTGTARPSSGSG